MALQLDAVRVVRGTFVLTADLEVEAGTMTAILGPSGCGKSTLLNAVAGFLPLTQGRILWRGKDLGPLSPGDRPVTMVFQEHNLFPHLTVAQNVGLGANPHLRLTSDDKDRIREVLGRTGIADLADRRPPDLSGGQRSRAALARALLRDRPVLLLDEPFAALGPALRLEMLDLVAEIAAARTMTVLMITHDPRDAIRIAGQTILVAEGRAHPPEPTGTLLANPPEALRAYLGT